MIRRRVALVIAALAFVLILVNVVATIKINRKLSNVMTQYPSATPRPTGQGTELKKQWGALLSSLRNKLPVSYAWESDSFIVSKNREPVKFSRETIAEFTYYDGRVVHVDLRELKDELRLVHDLISHNTEENSVFPNAIWETDNQMPYSTTMHVSSLIALQCHKHLATGNPEAAFEESRYLVRYCELLRPSTTLYSLIALVKTQQRLLDFLRHATETHYMPAELRSEMEMAYSSHRAHKNSLDYLRFRKLLAMQELELIYKSDSEKMFDGRWGGLEFRDRLAVPIVKSYGTFLGRVPLCVEFENADRIYTAAIDELSATGDIYNASYWVNYVQPPSYGKPSILPYTRWVSDSAHVADKYWLIQYIEQIHEIEVFMERNRASFDPDIVAIQ